MSRFHLSCMSPTTTSQLSSSTSCATPALPRTRRCMLNNSSHLLLLNCLLCKLLACFLVGLFCLNGTILLEGMLSTLNFYLLQKFQSKH
uniref:Uncharacterized protein n=1 Tax=Aegilops tauschii subsp. strangulata TaxID=200361 RepID=A0A453EJD6_AEGTS